MNLTEIEKGITHISLNDEKLSFIISVTEKCPLHPKRNYYRALLRSIVGQQLSVKAAAAINKKFLKNFNNKPEPEKILNTPNEVLRNLGLSNAKTKYVKDLSQKILNKEIKLNGFHKKNNFEIISDLTQVKGIGNWTVHMFLIFTLARLDILPVNDLGLKKL